MSLTPLIVNLAKNMRKKIKLKERQLLLIKKKRLYENFLLEECADIDPYFWSELLRELFMQNYKIEPENINLK